MEDKLHKHAALPRGLSRIPTDSQSLKSSTGQAFSVDLFLTVSAKSFISTFPSASVTEFHDQSWSLAFRTAWRTTCHDWAYKGCKFQPSFHFSPALTERESVGIWLRPLRNAIYVACLPLICKGPSGLILRVSDWSNPSWIPQKFYA